MSSIKKWLSGLGVLWVLVMNTPQAAWACAVCSAGREDDSRMAFILMTAFMTFLPLTIVGSFVWWLRARARALEVAEPATVSAAEPARVLPKPSSTSQG
jgi:hypothetical protein